MTEFPSWEASQGGGDGAGPGGKGWDLAGEGGKGPGEGRNVMPFRVYSLPIRLL